MQELEELHLLGCNFGALLLSEKSDVAEDTLHLALVVAGEVTPQLDDHRLEVAVDVVALGQRGSERARAHLLG